MEAARPRDQSLLCHERRAEARTGIDDVAQRSIPFEPAARDDTIGPAEVGGAPAGSTPSTTAWRDTASRLWLEVGKRLSTLAIALVAILVSILTWQHYVTAPWTRNGTVRVQVANVAPQISGKIVELRVADNQFVHRGDILYVIDPFDFEVAVGLSKTLIEQRAADVEVKLAESDRRQHLSNLATTPEEQQIYAGSAEQAKAAYQAAAHQFAQAEVNLKRTNVVSPVDGYITNLLLRAGDYAVTGVSNISVIDTDSFWIDGYFEETKMARVCVGDPAEAQLIGYKRPILGHVKTVTRGISVARKDCPTSIQSILGFASRSAYRFVLPSIRCRRKYLSSLV
jgi:multidrug resistance efflux pump